MLYSGYVVSAAMLVLALVRNHARGYAWRRALPPGYAVSLAGAVVFAVSGVLDMLWHIIFGIEVSVEALFSPTHLLLSTRSGRGDSHRRTPRRYRGVVRRHVGPRH